MTDIKTALKVLRTMAVFRLQVVDFLLNTKFVVMSIGKGLFDSNYAPSEQCISYSYGYDILIFSTL